MLLPYAATLSQALLAWYRRLLEGGGTDPSSPQAKEISETVMLRVKHLNRPDSHQGSLTPTTMAMQRQGQGLKRSDSASWQSMQSINQSTQKPTCIVQRQVQSPVLPQPSRSNFTIAPPIHALGGYLQATACVFLTTIVAPSYETDTISGTRCCDEQSSAVYDRLARTATRCRQDGPEGSLCLHCRGGRRIGWQPSHSGPLPCMPGTRRRCRRAWPTQAKPSGSSSW